MAQRFRIGGRLAGCSGSRPSNMTAATSSHDQGISRAGNDRLQSVMVQLAWGWVHWQPQSALTRWYQARFGAGKRTRKVGIVALARKLLIALWRWATQRHRADRGDRAGGVSGRRHLSRARRVRFVKGGRPSRPTRRRYRCYRVGLRLEGLRGPRLGARSDRRRARSHDRTLAPTTREAEGERCAPSRE